LSPTEAPPQSPVSQPNARKTPPHSRHHTPVPVKGRNPRTTSIHPRNSTPSRLGFRVSSSRPAFSRRLVSLLVPSDGSVLRLFLIHRANLHPFLVDTVDAVHVFVITAHSVFHSIPFHSIPLRSVPFVSLFPYEPTRERRIERSRPEPKNHECRVRVSPYLGLDPQNDASNDRFHRHTARASRSVGLRRSLARSVPFRPVPVPVPARPRARVRPRMTVREPSRW